MQAENFTQFDEVEIKVLDKDGNLKRQFQDNKFFTWLMNHGIVSPNFPKIPFLLGHWSDTKIVKIQKARA